MVSPPRAGLGISDVLLLELKNGVCVCVFSRLPSGSLDVCFLFILRVGSLLFPGALRYFQIPTEFVFPVFPETA